MKVLIYSLNKDTTPLHMKQGSIATGVKNGRVGVFRKWRDWGISVGVSEVIPFAKNVFYVPQSLFNRVGGLLCQQFILW